MSDKSTKLIAIVGIIVCIVIGYLMYSSTSQNKLSQDLIPTQNNVNTVQDTSSDSDSAYSGTVIAGKESPYIDFNEADFNRAKQEGKIIILDYYANWCPICRAEQPDLQAGFEQLNNPNVIGFRVNYNDTETDDFEKGLAKEHAIVYQHTKVILKDGEVVLKDGQVWSTEDFIENVSSIL